MPTVIVNGQPHTLVLDHTSEYEVQVRAVGYTGLVTPWTESIFATPLPAFETWYGSVAIGAGPTISVDASRTTFLDTTIAADASLTADPFVSTESGSINIASTTSVSVEGGRSINSFISITTASTLSAVGAVGTTAQASITSASDLEVDGHASRPLNVYASLSVAGTINAYESISIDGIAMIVAEPMDPAFRAPRDIITVSATGTEVELVWEGVPRAIAYDVERNGIIIRRVFEERIVDTDVVPASYYEYRVRSVAIQREGV